MMSPLQQSFQERICAGDMLLGGFVFSTDPNVTEIHAVAGFDFVIADLEDTMGDPRIAAVHPRAARADETAFRCSTPHIRLQLTPS